MSKADADSHQELQIYHLGSSGDTLEMGETYHLAPHQEKKLLYVIDELGRIKAVVSISFLFSACNAVRRKFVWLSFDSIKIIVQRNQMNGALRNIIKYYKKLKEEMHKVGKKMGSKINYRRRQKYQGPSYSFA